MTDPLYIEAIHALRSAVDQARRHEIPEPYSAALATADTQAHPSVRMITVAAVEQSGLLFFVDTRSGKAQQLRDNPSCGLCFFWRTLGQQVNVQGKVEILDEALSDQYWSTRSRERKLASWAYEGPVPAENDAADPAARVEAYDTRFRAQAVERPDHWSALRLHPYEFRFWKLGWSDLHERVAYSQDEAGQWNKHVLDPFS